MFALEVCSRMFSRLLSSVAVLLVLPALLSVTTSASEPDSAISRAHGFLGKSQIGVRFGVWSNQGERPPGSGKILVDGTDIGGGFSANINNEAFFFQGYFGHRWSRLFMLELAAGTTNRGSVTISDSSESDIGNLILYPITLQVRMYPVGRLAATYPYVSGGLGVHIGRRTVQFTSSGYYFSNWEDETAYDVNWVLGCGIDVPLASQIGLDLNVQYLPVDFNSSLLTVKDYSAIALSVGVKYLYFD